MRIAVTTAVAALVVVANVAAQGTAPSAREADDGLRTTIRARLDAYGRGDADAWGGLVVDDCLCSSTTKAAIVREITARPRWLRAWFGEITDFQARVRGNTATTRYVVTEYTELGGQRVAFPQLRVESYERRDGEWMLIAGVDSVIPVDPPTVPVSPKTYDELVGEYEYGPGVRDTVTREGGRLMLQPAGQAKEELFAQDEWTYFGKGQAWRMLFVRDANGRVTSVRFRMQEQDLIGKKVR